MHIRTLALSAAIASVMLAACSQPADTTAPPIEPATPAETTLAPAPEAPAAEAPAADATAAPDAAATEAAATPDPAAPAPEPAAAAASASCAIDMTGDDMMKFSVSSITVPASCSQFTINFRHIGKLPVAAMGHNVVIAKESDAAGIVADGMAVKPEHLKAGDTRVIAATKMVGGGQSSSVTFDVSKITGGGPYQFFCSFPGHYVLMKGSIAVQ